MIRVKETIMKTMAISKFKAQCLAELEKVRITGEPLMVTRFGKPIATVNPPKAKVKQSWLGCMEGSVETMGDIVGPSTALDEWGVYKE